MARETYTRGIECPNCQEKGTLHISENDYPFMRKLGREVDSVDGPFSASMHDESKIAAVCKACGTEFIV